MERPVGRPPLVRLHVRDRGRATVERHAVGYQAVVDLARARGHFERGPYG